MGWNLGNIIAQLVATNNFTGTDRYLLGTYEGTWNLFYRNLRDANNLLALGEATDNGGYQASALVMRAWILANLTEMWGDVPYSEALGGKEDEFLPSYDPQANIYQSILDDLDQRCTAGRRKAVTWTVISFSEVILRSGHAWLTLCVFAT